MIKVHSKDGVIKYLNPKYIVRFEDHEIIIDDFVYNPDCRGVESKQRICVFETSDEIQSLIEGFETGYDINEKYRKESEVAKQNSLPF